MKVLLLTSTLPWPQEMHGGAQRTALLLEALRKKAEVDLAFVSWSEESVKRAQESLGGGEKIVGIFHVPAPESSSLGPLARLPLVGKPIATIQLELLRYRNNEPLCTWLAALARDARYDAIVSRYLWPGAVSGLRQISNVSKLLDWDDLDHLKLQSRIQAEPWKGVRGALTKSLILSKIKKFCVAEAASYNHVWVAKPSDSTAFTAKSVSVLPNIPYMEQTDPSLQQGKRRDILFIGSQTYLPNSEALTTFLETAWPRILDACPDTRVLAIGPPPEPETAKRWKAVSGVEIVGVVPTLTQYYRRAALSICPVEWGGGSNIKAIESLAYGVPCVTSPYTYEAFKADFNASSGMICAHTEDDYVSACIDLIENPERSASLGQAGLEVVLARYSRSRFQSIVAKGLASATEQKLSRLNIAGISADSEM